MNTININPKKDLIFDIKAREMCKHCKRYGKKATCPPYIESVEYYSKLFPTYQHGIFYYESFPVNDDAMKIGRKSSLIIYNKISSERNALFADGHYFIMGLGAGSCKLCKKCTFPCPMPERSLIPIEATGIDVVKTMNRLGVAVSFPVDRTIFRIGSLFYD